MGTHRTWRLARQLAPQYENPSPDCGALRLPRDTWERAEQYLRDVARAEHRGWPAAARGRRQELARELDQLLSRLHDFRRQFFSERPPQAPTLRFLWEELTAIEREFGVFEYEDRTLSVTTEPITLEGIDLGRFAIRLDLDQLPGAGYQVTALDPRPAATCADTTHPHVHEDRLCAGEGRAAIAAALGEGRLFDFFTIVDRILHTYSPGSAYVELAQWHGTPCRDCDDVVATDESCACRCCGRTLCEDCLTACDVCEAGYCSRCLMSCAVCERRCCLACRRHVRAGRYSGVICNPCAEEEDDAAKNETAPSDTHIAGDAEPALHADGLGEAAIST